MDKEQIKKNINEMFDDLKNESTRQVDKILKNGFLESEGMPDIFLSKVIMTHLLIKFSDQYTPFQGCAEATKKAFKRIIKTLKRI